MGWLESNLDFFEANFSNFTPFFSYPVNMCSVAVSVFVSFVMLQWDGVASIWGGSSSVESDLVGNQSNESSHKREKSESESCPYDVVAPRQSIHQQQLIVPWRHATAGNQQKHDWNIQNAT